jgi:N-acetyl-anhydromuramyl-L-alanine amidase AmpD
MCDFIIRNTLVNFTGGNYKKEYIVFHYTGNVTDTAIDNANYFYSVNRDASANFFIDKESVVQVVPENACSWAVGVNYGGRLFGTVNNYNSINIELCSTNGVISEKTIQNAVDFSRTLMARHGIPVINCVRHYDVCGKRCPGWNGWLPGNETKWNDLLNRLSEKTSTVKEITGMQEFFFRVSNIDKNAVFYCDGRRIVVLKHPDEKKIIEITTKDAGRPKLHEYKDWTTKAPWHQRVYDVLSRPDAKFSGGKLV